MVRRNTRSSYSRNDDNDSRNSRRGSSSRGGGGYSRGQSNRRGGYERETVKEDYYPIFSLFFNDNGGGRSPSKLNIKRYDTDNGSIEDVITLAEWLKIAELLYYGEIRLDGALWESDAQYATHTGNVRLTGTQIEELLDRSPDELPDDEEDEPAPRKKAAAKKPARSKKAAPPTRERRAYKEEIIEEVDEEELPFDDDDEEDTIEEEDI